MGEPDKEMKPLLESMITTELKPAIRRFLNNYVLQLLGELYDSTRTDIKELTSDENKRVRAFVEIVLRSDRVKTMLVKVLEMLPHRKVEIVSLLLEKFGMLHGNADVNFYHDKVSVFFDEELEIIKKLIRAEEYRELYKRTSYNSI